MTKKILLSVLLLTLSFSLFAISGREVAEYVDNREKGETSHSLIIMDLIEKNGSVSSRTMESYSQKDELENVKSVMIFHAPASVKNTRFLMVENEGDKDDDRWIYLPAMKRIRRIAASEGDSSFMGSDFTYDDMSPGDINDYSYTLIGEETIDGKDCYIVEAIPVNLEDNQYSRMVSWIAKDIWINLKTEMYDKKNNLYKVVTAEKIEQVQGIWTPIITKMENVQNGHSTVLTAQKLIYNENFPPSLFSTRFLQNGRP